MKFNVKADKMLFVNGKIKSIKAGEVDTTDKGLIAALDGAKDVEKATPKTSKAKQEKQD